MTLESQIFDEKALDKPVSFLDFWSPKRSREERMEAAILSFRDRLFCCLSFVS